MVTLCSLSFTWKIPNFAELDRTKTQTLLSPKVRGSGTGGTEFYVSLSPWGFNDSSEDPVEDADISVRLWADEVGEPPVKVGFGFSILDSSFGQNFKILDEKTIAANGDGSGFLTFASRKDLLSQKNKFLPGGTLTVLVELTILNEIMEKNFQSRSSKVDEMEDLPRDLLKLFRNGDHADRTFVVGGSRFAVHGAILAARSPELFNMFAGTKSIPRTEVEEEDDVEILWPENWPERDRKQNGESSRDGSNQVEVRDIKPEVFECLLQAIYTETMVENLEEHAEGILRAADIFGLTKLKLKAEKALIEKIEVQSVARLFLLAYNHDAPELKEKSLKFLIDNRQVVKGTPGWRELFKNPEVMFELFANIP